MQNYVYTINFRLPDETFYTVVAVQALIMFVTVCLLRDWRRRNVVDSTRFAHLSAAWHDVDFAGRLVESKGGYVLFFWLLATGFHSLMPLANVLCNALSIIAEIWIVAFVYNWWRGRGLIDLGGRRVYVPLYEVENPRIATRETPWRIDNSDLNALLLQAHKVIEDMRVPEKPVASVVIGSSVAVQRNARAEVLREDD